jgi:segregation and condensation protein B
MAPHDRPALDRDLADLPQAVRWRTFMGRVEAVIFAASRPVTRAELAEYVGADCPIDDLVGDIRAELRARPYDLVPVAGGWQFRTRATFADVLAPAPVVRRTRDLTSSELQILAGIAWHQPVTRADLGEIFGREIGRDIIADLRADGLIATGPRAPRPGAPVTYVTTPRFLERFGLESLHDLPDPEQQDAGVL